jgi:hypothetical protein
MSQKTHFFTFQTIMLWFLKKSEKTPYDKNFAFFCLGIVYLGKHVSENGKNGNAAKK